MGRLFFLSSSLGWSPRIVNPTRAGWLTVFAYLLAASLCYRVYRRLCDSPHDGRQGAKATLRPWLLALTGQRRRLSEIPDRARGRSFWIGLAAALFLLGIGKQLDLLTPVTALGRLIATHQGWYGRRRKVQEIFIGGVIVAGCVGFRSVWVLIKGQERRAGPALLGIVCLVSYVGIRAVSFHYLDALLRSKIGGLELSAALELGGLALVAWGALRVGQAADVAVTAGEAKARH
jgi:hypothetical protein